MSTNQEQVTCIALHPPRWIAPARKPKGNAVVKVRYLGISDPKATFNELRPYRERLIGMMGQCRPFHADFLILHAAQKALDAAAH